MNEYNMNTMKEFIELFVSNLKIKGIPNIDNVSAVSDEKIVYYNNENHNLETKTSHIIYTDGINLTDIRYLNGIDLSKTICNDITSIYENFGIEATRAVLLKEFTYTYAASGSNINYQHMSLLVDIMTNNGDITSIDRHGMNRIDNDPLSRASFEMTVDRLLSAAVFNKSDSMNSVSSRIMAGLAIRGGTGYCNLILDNDAIEKSEYTEEVTGLEYKKSYSELQSNIVVDDIISKEENEIFMPME